MEEMPDLVEAKDVNEVTCKCPLCRDQTISKRHFKKDWKSMVKKVTQQFQAEENKKQVERDIEEANTELSSSEREDLAWTCIACGTNNKPRLRNHSGVYTCQCSMARPE